MEQHVGDDFPIDWEADGFVSRREFFKFMTVASGGLAVGSIAMAAWSKIQRTERTFEPKRICDASSLHAGTAMAFSYPRPTDICLVMRHPDGTISAFSRRCTHLSCPVNYEADKDRLFCPCHNGAFSARDGKVLQGPPPHALPQIKIEERNGELWAIGVRKGESI